MAEGKDLQVQKAAEYGYVTHYQVRSGKEGGSPVTVRVGRAGVFACLTCYKTDCVHANAARGFARDEAETERVDAARAADEKAGAA